MASPQISVQALISVERKNAWVYYTHPDHIKKWNFASEDWHCPAASNDVRVGGKYCSRMEAKDGSLGFDFEAVYSHVVEEEKLDYTMGDGRKATVSFTQHGLSTQVTVVFEAEDQNPVELQRAGWQAILNNFKKHAESF